jgi:hypothetical protein
MAETLRAHRVVIVGDLDQPNSYCARPAEFLEGLRSRKHRDG